MQCFIDDYSLIKSIGRGNFGEVFLTQKNGSKELYATKKMERSVCERPPLWNRLINEIQILKMVNHPNIVKFKDLKKSQNHWYLITEYVNGGSLLSNLKKYMSIYRKPFPEDVVQYLMKQIVNALYYLHMNRIIHRDLKLDNILVSYPSEYDKQSLNLKNCQVKIIDFGFATILNNALTFTALGTPHNMEPEILKQISTGEKNQGYNEKVDIWSLGTLCYEMIVGHSPFMGANMKELYKNVKEGNYTLPSSLSEEIVSFIQTMIQQDPNERFDASQLMNHKFLVNPVSTFHPADVHSLKATYLPGGLINMKSKQPQPKTVNYAYNDLNNWNIWGIFNQQDLYQNTTPVQVPAQIQPKPQPKMQMQIPKASPQYIIPGYQQQPQVQYQQTYQQAYQQQTQKQYQQPQQNYYYNQKQNNYGTYY